MIHLLKPEDSSSSLQPKDSVFHPGDLWILNMFQPNDLWMRIMSNQLLVICSGAGKGPLWPMAACSKKVCPTILILRREAFWSCFNIITFRISIFQIHPKVATNPSAKAEAPGANKTKDICGNLKIDPWISPLQQVSPANMQIYRCWSCYLRGFVASIVVTNWFCFSDLIWE